MNIGFDMFTTANMLNSMAAFTGGSNYALGILGLLQKEKNVSIKILLPEVEKINNDFNRQLLIGNNCSFAYANNILAFDYADIDIMFFPQVNGHLLEKISHIHKKNPAMKIYATLHDRQHNIFRYDRYDTYYENGLFRISFFAGMRFLLKKLAFDYVYAKNAKFIDKIFTVSNYSAQKLIQKKINNIYVFQQGNTLKTNVHYEQMQGDYILFVGGNRPEKNLLRTLEAFCIYKKTHSDKTKFVVTGVNDQLVNRLIGSKKLDETVLKTEVQFLGYVDSEKLSELYLKSKYVAFLSKGEGYGLPVLEAICYGKAVLASGVTSIPEVAGAAVKYVDPYSVKSIADGFLFFSNDENLKRYTAYASERSKYVIEISQQDMKIMVHELLE